VSTIENKYDDGFNVPNQTWGIFLISVLGLLLETLFIRWIGTEIRIFAYLQNTILVACFLGLGLGAFTSSKQILLRQSLIPMVILLLLMAIPATRSLLGGISEKLSVFSDLNIFYAEAVTDPKAMAVNLTLGLLMTLGALILIVDIFVPLGRILGRLMNTHPNPIWAYSINIFGSILGTWSFVLLSFFYQPPFIWFLVVGGLLAFFITWSNRNQKLNFALLSAALVLSWFAGQVPGSMQVIWSPYQKLVVRPTLPTEVGTYAIDVNNVGYQGMVDLSDAHFAADPKNFPPEIKGMTQYEIPLLLHPNPKKVLLVGAGSGNDAAGAIRQGAESITAVEIDPAIISIGRELHPEKPYSSPTVRVVNDDARSFFATTKDKYDVIVFGLLDSHTTTALTNARLDHYVYTLESLTQARKLLNDGGVMVLSFQPQKPFITIRLRKMIRQVFNEEPLVFRVPYSTYEWGGVMFVAGDLRAVQQQFNNNPRLDAYIKRLQQENPIPQKRNAAIITDDWPYLYLEAPSIPILYYFLIGLMVLIFFISYKRWQAAGNISGVDRSFWHFFFLGAAFLLLEVQNISKASVALGNTWQVNVVIISSILIMALLANLIAYKFPKLHLIPIYIGLITVCLMLYFIDLARFGFLPYFTKAMIVGLLTSLPMLFSGIVFIRSFAVAKEKGNVLGANLIGALVGALLQSITFITGIKALLLIVAGFYLLSLITMLNSQKRLNS